MKRSICLFEDAKLENLLPLVFLRPVYELRCGILTLREKVVHYFPTAKIALHTRKMLHNAVQERNPKLNVNNYPDEDLLLINGRLLIEKNIAKEIKKLEVDTVLRCEEDVVAANVSSRLIRKILTGDSEYPAFECQDLSTKETQAKLFKYPWEIVNENGKQITADYQMLVREEIILKKFPSVEYTNKKEIFVAKDARIDPFVHIDASKGPVYISKNAHIMSHSFIQGPVFIGEGSIIKAHAVIYHDTSIGEVCKVGGEVEASIIHSYSNKQHDGFLGHAYLGSWVNIGASTNNSDLKNNYGNVSVLIKGKSIDSKSQFVGLILGDHSKTAINTMFNTGTVAGIACNIFGAGFPKRYIPSFSWGGSESIQNYEIERCIEVARLVIERRKLNLTQAEEELLRAVYELTKQERESFE
jgi:UDP-N-acetylglucosamine diphosphorylase/glucosamine-1-phosphate N-acetyltransferase